MSALTPSKQQHQQITQESLHKNLPEVTVMKTIVEWVLMDLLWENLYYYVVFDICHCCKNLLSLCCMPPLLFSYCYFPPRWQRPCDFGLKWKCQIDVTSMPMWGSLLSRLLYFVFVIYFIVYIYYCLVDMKGVFVGYSLIQWTPGTVNVVYEKYDFFMHISLFYSWLIQTNLIGT